MPTISPLRIKMSPQCRLRIYVGFDSPTIIRCLESLTYDVFIARFSDCKFDDAISPPLWGRKTIPIEQRDIM